MTEKALLLKEYLLFTGSDPVDIERMPISGSDRQYFRFVGKERTIIGVYNPGSDENRTFIGFTHHFRTLKLPVPEILYQNLGSDIYFLEDLGDINLFTWIEKRRKQEGFDGETVVLYKKVLDRLIEFQVGGIIDLDTNLCYPHRSFDKQSMIWDMNYFKYMFLKLVSVSFNEKRLEQDFSKLSNFLLKAGQEYFLYRDFQSANIMIVDNEPWFIDYQGGRMGAAQYDVASLLYDSKAHIPQQVREILLEYYIPKFCKVAGADEAEFRKYLPGFIVIRLMQALGAYGYRGLYEKKPGFAQSIIPAVKDLKGVIEQGLLNFELPELSRIITGISSTDRFDVVVNHRDIEI